MIDVKVSFHELEMLMTALSFKIVDDENYILSHVGENKRVEKEREEERALFAKLKKEYYQG